MKALFRVVAVLSLLLLVACRSSTPASESKPAGWTAASSSAPAPAPRPASWAADGGGAPILATGYVVRLPDGSIILDEPTPPRREGRALYEATELTHYELKAESEVTKELDQRLMEIERESVNAHVVPFSFLVPFPRDGEIQEEVPADRLLFSTRYSKATRYSPMVVTVRGRLLEVDYRERNWKKERITPEDCGGTIFRVDPTSIEVMLDPQHAVDWTNEYARAVRTAARQIQPGGKLASIERASAEIDDARDHLKNVLGDAASDYEAFRFIDGIASDLSKALVSKDPVDFASALRPHLYWSWASADAEVRPFHLREEKELVLRLDLWIHDYAAKAYFTEKDKERAHTLGAIVIKADELRLGPVTWEIEFKPRISSPAAQAVARRFPDLAPSRDIQLFP